MGEKEVDQALVERVQQGDKRAFEVLVLKYQQRIQGLIGRYIRDPVEVQDVAQETFIRAYRALGQFRSDSAFYTWLYRIAVNTAKNHLTALGRKPPLEDIDASEAERYDIGVELHEYASPDRLLEREEVEHAILRAVDALPEDLRTAITLREMDGLSYQEIAVAMGCPIGTVRSRISRAREAIDRQITSLYEL